MISLGTPPQWFDFALDTGTADTAVLSADLIITSSMYQLIVSNYRKGMWINAHLINR